MKLKSKNTSGSNQEHALLSPSSAKKWLNCPAALACEFGLPNESGQAAVNGTVMHLVAETVLNRVIKGDDITADKYKGVYALNEGKGPIKALVKPEKGAVIITDDFVSQVNKYVDYCRTIIDAAELVEVESRVNLTRVLHPGARLRMPAPGGGLLKDDALQTFGTADLVAVMPDGMLIVGDLKTGRHKVLAKENKQMMLYALGLLRVYKRLYDITAVRLVIFQPYAGGADEWDTTPEALEQFGKFAQGRALKAIDAFQRGKKGLTPADFRPGNDACRWCRFAEKCTAKSRAVKETDPQDGACALETEMSLDRLKAEYDKLPLMRQHIADIEKAMYSALMRGEQVEGLKLVEGRPGNRSWSDTDKVEQATNDHWGLIHKEVLLSPTEAEKALTPEMWAKVESFVTRKPGQPSIATSDDKRPAWTPATDSDLED
nr:MAG TPA: PD-(D/E)XK nuclease superfamily protein [Caudoviricetes sp.]